MKFDTINPDIYLNKKIEANESVIERMDRKDFLNWIISLRSNYSDFYTYNLSKYGWEGEEFFINTYYIDKVADELYGKGKSIKKFTGKIKNKISPVKNRWYIKVMIDYIKNYNPDIIFVREITGIQSNFWKTYTGNKLIVSRIDSNTPSDWSVSDYDLIFTSSDVYKSFFELNKRESYISQNGFDGRILKELKSNSKTYDITFVGGVVDRYWTNRARCIEFIADKVDFKWWGIKGTNYKKENPISKSWQGITSGIEMFEIYKQSRIVFNDYSEVANKTANNQRMYEAMGVGTLLLTREAENIKKQFPDNIFVTFRDEKDCLDKINYYLKNEKEREEIALAGQKFVLENYTYEKLMKETDTILRNSYKRKFSK